MTLTIKITHFEFISNNQNSDKPPTALTRSRHRRKHFTQIY
ncbi:hypothetical protein PROVRUST_06350 [Providencia rustigianii DSM 4541]|uniref:Uncharacterized protein n=1 Tax=Providencia rustigianii DSM 4541 TaxID=500637 RepID=D1P2C6_9GAMM|nr:hypothetical protein PROVRUST_06350 [Providencia rustigianii DSM 4541]